MADRLLSGVLGSRSGVRVLLATVGLCLLEVVLVALASGGGLLAAVAVGFAAFVLVLVLVGRERGAILLLMAAFVMAPSYKGLASSPSATITPTDVALVLAIILLVPSMIARRIRVPTMYTIGLVITVMMGLISTLVSASPAYSAYQFAQWLSVVMVLLMFMAAWGPSWRVVRLLSWCYVAGQSASLLKALISGPVGEGGRYQGLAHHPNAFAEGGMMAFAILLYLFARANSTWHRVLIVVLSIGALESVVISGSRAALLVVAGLIVMVPIVERSAWLGVLGGAVAAIFVVLIPLVTQASGQGSALSRLAGDSSATGADEQRSTQLHLGLDLFFHHPLFGAGFDQVGGFHNIFLEVAAASGVLGLTGYLLILYCMARPLFGAHPERRLVYVVFAYIGLTGTVPGMEDRTLWMPMSLAFMVAVRDVSRHVKTARTTAACSKEVARSPKAALPPAASIHVRSAPNPEGLHP